MSTGIILDTEYRLLIRVKRDEQGKILSGISIGDSSDQNAALVLELSQGELKEDPLMGCGLTVFQRGKYSKTKIERRVKAHFKRAGIDYDEYKERLDYRVNQ